MIVNRDDDAVVAENRAPARILEFPVTKVNELQAHRRIHEQHARSPKEERERAHDPLPSIAAFVCPAAVGREVLPCAGVCEE